MRLRPTILLILPILLGAVAAPAQSARIFWSPDLVGTVCYAVAPRSQQTTLYILAEGEDVAGAEFRTTGLPAWGTGVVWQTRPNPVANLNLGDPTASGCNIAFATCQMRSSVPVLLYSIDVIPLVDAAPYYELGIEQHATPSNVLFSCPLINLCDAPTYTEQCVSRSGRFTLMVDQSIRTPTDPTPADGATTVPIDTHLSVGNLGQDPGCQIGIAFRILSFGTSPDPPRVADSEFCTPTCYTNPFDPGLLQPETTYYWKLTHCGNDGVCSDSDLWSFTTGKTVGVDSRAWSQVKHIYR